MKRKTVSLCMIARDEEATIGLAVKSIMALVDEIIVVDTGSSDNTRIIAEGYGARVIDFPWQDDFAAARNAGLAETSSEWILILDADERLQPVRPVEFQRLLKSNEVAGYRLQLRGPAGGQNREVLDRVRLFRNEPDIQYRYPIHEQVTPALEDWAVQAGLEIRESELMVLHEGRAQQNSVDRRDRNLRILRQAVVGDAHEPYFEYQMACEMLVTLEDEVLPVAGLSESLHNLERSWHKIQAFQPDERRRLTYAPDLAAKLTAAYLCCSRIEQACQVAEEGRRLHGDQPLLLLQAIAADTRFLQESAPDQAPERTTSLLARVRCDIDSLRSGPENTSGLLYQERIRTLYPLRYLGELALLEGKVSTAAELFEKALTIDHSYSFAWLGLAECARFAGDRKRALKLYLRTVTENERNHRAWLRGSSLLEELEFHDNAASWRRKVMTHFPEHPLLQRTEVGLHEPSQPRVSV